MWDAFELLQSHAGGFPLAMGFEVNHSKLMELGMQWAPYLAFDGSNEFLLEFSSRAGKAQFDEYERTIFELQGMGYQVIIAHPERYRAVQEDVEVARRLAKMGCKLQAPTSWLVVVWVPRKNRLRSCLRKTCTATSPVTPIAWSITTIWRALARNIARAASMRAYKTSVRGG